MQPLAVAGSHLETEEKENIPERGKRKHVLYKNVSDVKLKYVRQHYMFDIYDFRC